MLIIFTLTLLIGILALPALLIREWCGEWDWETIKELYKFLWES